MKKFTASILLTCFIVFSSPSHADTRLPFKPTSIELSALPDYCRARLGGNKELQKSWAQKMGQDNYAHLHHFCTGLNYMNRIQISAGSKHRKHYMQTALAQFNYVLRRWPESFFLTQEAKNYKAQLEFQMKMI